MSVCGGVRAWTHRIVLAQMAGSGRGDLGSYGGGDYVQLRDYLLENPVTKVCRPPSESARARARRCEVVCAGLLLTDCARSGMLLPGWRRVVRRAHAAEQGAGCVS